MEKEGNTKFKEWFFHQTPENRPIKGKWKRLEGTFQKLLVLRALRPDRTIPALTNFILKRLPEGEKFVNMDQSNSFYNVLKSTYIDATKDTLNTPIFFILSQGADPAATVEHFGLEEGFTTTKNNYYNIALGEGQDKIAEERLEVGIKEGHWILL